VEAEIVIPLAQSMATARVLARENVRANRTEPRGDVPTQALGSTPLFLY
jgi:hypothetical protein